MGISCFLIMPQNSLLNHAITSILVNPTFNLKLANSQAANGAELIREIGLVRPDVILIGETMPLAQRETLSHLLMSFPELKIIVISEETNWLHVFHKKDWLMTQESDLLALVCS